MKHISLAILLSFITTVLVDAQRPAEQGHPLMPPYPGSTAGPPAKTVEFEEFNIPIGPGTNKGFKTERVEGRMTSFSYGRPKDRSQLEIFRNYEEALKNAGFQTLFTCTGRE